MSAPLYFLPWLRRGIGLALANPTRAGRAAARRARRRVGETVDETPGPATLALRPPDHATGIDPTQIIRRYPAPDTVDAEYGYFPLIELSAPDLPWVLTPAAADDDADAGLDGPLRPWLVLVCVEDAAAELVPGADGRPARLLVAAEQLPDLAESYAWAHVQSIVPRDDVVASLSDTPAPSSPASSARAGSPRTPATGPRSSPPSRPTATRSSRRGHEPTATRS